MCVAKTPENNGECFSSGTSHCVDKDGSQSIAHRSVEMMVELVPYYFGKVVARGMKSRKEEHTVSEATKEQKRMAITAHNRVIWNELDPHYAIKMKG